MDDTTGSYRVFALSVIEGMVAELWLFVRRRNRRTVNASIGYQGSAKNITFNAISSMLFIDGAIGRRGLTFSDLAGGCGQDVDAMRERIFRQFELAGESTQRQFKRLRRLAANAERFAEEEERKTREADETPLLIGNRTRKRCLELSGTEPSGFCFYCGELVPKNRRKYCKRSCSVRFSNLTRGVGQCKGKAEENQRCLDRSTQPPNGRCFLCDKIVGGNLKGPRKKYCSPDCGTQFRNNTA